MGVVQKGSRGSVVFTKRGCTNGELIKWGFFINCTLYSEHYILNTIYCRNMIWHCPGWKSKYCFVMLAKLCSLKLSFKTGWIFFLWFLLLTVFQPCIQIWCHVSKNCILGLLNNRKCPNDICKGKRKKVEDK